MLESRSDWRGRWGGGREAPLPVWGHGPQDGPPPGPGPDARRLGFSRTVFAAGNSTAPYIGKACCHPQRHVGSVTCFIVPCEIACVLYVPDRFICRLSRYTILRRRLVFVHRYHCPVAGQLTHVRCLTRCLSVRSRPLQLTVKQWSHDPARGETRAARLPRPVLVRHPLLPGPVSSKHKRGVNYSNSLLLRLIVTCNMHLYAQNLSVVVRNMMPV